MARRKTAQKNLPSVGTKSGDRRAERGAESRAEVTAKQIFLHPATVCAFLGVITLAVFWPAGRADFVNYDDADYVTANAHVQSGLTWSNVIWAFTTGHASNWHPFTWLSHMLDCQLFGTGPAAMHLVSVFLHALNTVLVFLVLKRLTDARWRSALVAALFCLHPLHVESVAWISERKDVLSGLFFLLTLWAYGNYAGKTSEGHEEAQKDRARKGPLPMNQEQIPVPVNLRRDEKAIPSDADPSPQRRGEPARLAGGSLLSRPNVFYGLALVFFACGLMSKPMLVTTPFILLLLDFWPLGRLGKLEPERAAGPIVPITRGRAARLILEKLPFFALALASSVVTFVVQRKGGAVSTSLPLGGRLANAAVSYARYLGKTFWPEKLSVLYPHPGYWPVWAVIGSTALVVILTILAVWQWRRRPYLAFGWFWFLGGLVPVIGFVQVGIQSMADRYMYLPSIGLFVALVWGIQEAVGDLCSADANTSTTDSPPIAGSMSVKGTGARGPLSPNPSRVPPGVVVSPRAVLSGGGAVLVLVICAALTSRQLGFWRDSEWLFTHAVEVTARNYLAYNNLGFYLSGQGRSAEAMQYYAKSLEINPRYEDALNNMGYALAGQKKYQDAIGYYEAALKVRPDQVEVHNNLGNALSETGRINEAIREYLYVLSKQPDHADAHNNLGIALAMQGKLDEAIGHFRQAIQYKPKYASAYSNLGNALAAQRKFDEATQDYEQSLRLNPNDAQAHNNLGNVLSELGRLDEAIAQYREALRLNSDNPEAHFNLGLALARHGQRPEAVAHLTEAVRLKPDYAEARKQLEAMAAADDRVK